MPPATRRAAPGCLGFTLCGRFYDVPVSRLIAERSRSAELARRLESRFGWRRALALGQAREFLVELGVDRAVEASHEAVLALVKAMAGDDDLVLAGKTRIVTKEAT